MTSQTPSPTSTDVTIKDIEEARHRTRDVLDETPLAHSEYLSREWGCCVFFKLENLHFTGSFKERGALNKLLCLTDKQKCRGVITASAGNHGQAVAFHAQRLGIPATVVMPVNTPIIKVQNTERSGAHALLQGANFDEALAHALKFAERDKLTFVPGFDDPWIVAGQGTLGLEILEQNPYIEVVVVPVGGGGLIAGIALAIKETNPRVHIVGVQAENVPSMRVALERGRAELVEPANTLADGVAVRKVGELPFQLVKKYVDEIVTVGEDEIANAILLMLEREKTLVEGAGAVGVAALHNRKIVADGRKVACVLSGGNIDVNILSRIINKGLVKDGRLVKLRVLVPDYPGQLARILQVVAEERANILEVEHSRMFSAAKVNETAIDLVLETRGQQHIEETRAKLLAQGYRTDVMQF